jgi:hypothetical protein
MNEKEKKIKESRTIEAARKKLNGPDGKFGTIVRYLGEPIINQTSPNYSANYLDDPYSMQDENDVSQKFPYAANIYEYFGDEPEGDIWKERNYQTEMYAPSVIGWLFDGLSRGIHVEIKYLEQESKLTVYYKGYLVYCELSGDLTAYVPNDELEEKIDRLYKAAKQIAKQRQEQKKDNKLDKAKMKKENWLTRMRKQWGI